MVSDEKIGELALGVTKAHFGADKVLGVSVEAGLDPWDDEILRLTIRLTDGALENAPADAVLDTLVGIRRRLEEAGENRRPTLHYDAPEYDAVEDAEPVGGP